jgi:hypothetical protein
MQSLEEFCIAAAYIYVDLVLLHTRAEAIITCKMNGQLQHALMELGNVGQQKENADILLWISATAAAVIGAGRMESRMADLIDRFNAVLTRLEEVCII